MTFKTKPLPHQLNEWHVSRDLPTRAVLWEMGCGKSKLIIDTAWFLFEAQKINALVVIAPNGVHLNWVKGELPAHMPNEIEIEALAYESKKAKTKKHTRACENLISFHGLAVLVMSYDSAVTKAGYPYLKKFLEQRTCLYVLDECQRIKKPSAVRTRAIMRTANLAQYKRILTGTPVANRPWDVYKPVEFLDKDYWSKVGFSTYKSFETYYGIFRDIVTTSGRVISKPVASRHHSDLHAKLKPIMTRLLKEDVLKDLPDKLYTKFYFDSEPEEAKVYKQFAVETVAFFENTLVTAPIVLTKLLRLQQVISGFVPNPDVDGEIFKIGQSRIKAFERLIEDHEEPMIVWARFRHDIDQLANLLGERAVYYHGGTSLDERLEARRRFQEGEVQFFVGTPQAGAEGISLTRAQAVVYYSNSFNLTHRLQSEDRAHRIGQKNNVTIIDMQCCGTVDEYILEKLRSKKHTADEITGDPSTWLEQTELNDWLKRSLKPSAR